MSVSRNVVTLFTNKFCIHTWVPSTLIYLDISVLRDVLTLLTISFGMLELQKFWLLGYVSWLIWTLHLHTHTYISDCMIEYSTLAARSKCSNEPRGPKASKAHHETFVLALGKQGAEHSLLQPPLERSIPWPSVTAETTPHTTFNCFRTQIVLKLYTVHSEIVDNGLCVDNVIYQGHIYMPTYVRCSLRLPWRRLNLHARLEMKHNNNVDICIIFVPMFNKCCCMSSKLRSSE